MAIGNLFVFFLYFVVFHCSNAYVKYTLAGVAHDKITPPLIHGFPSRCHLVYPHDATPDTAYVALSLSVSLSIALLGSASCTASNVQTNVHDSRRPTERARLSQWPRFRGPESPH